MSGPSGPRDTSEASTETDPAVASTLDDFLTGGLVGRLPDARVRRLRMVNGMLFVGILYLAALGIYSMSRGHQTLAMAVWGSGAILLGMVFAIRFSRNDVWPPVVSVLVVGALIGWSYVTSAGDHAGILWLCVFPVAAVFSLGARVGGWVSLAALVIVFAALPVFGTPADLPTQDRATLLRLVMIYGALTGLSLFFELGRMRFETQLAQQNEVLGRRLKDLEIARRAAEAASVAKSRFLATVSHELRTPMNGVIGMAELLSTSRLDREQQEQIETIRSSGQSLVDIINDILDFSKIEAAEFRLRSEPFDVREQIEGVIQTLSAQAAAKGLQVEREVDPNAVTRRVGDAGRLRQVAMNLLGNAIKFTDSGRIRLRLLQMHSKDLRLEVEDTGPGISADDLSRLFQAFSQVDSSSTRQHGGSGLGLAISRRLVRMMGGDLYCRSEVGVGSTFVADLPLAEAPAPGSEDLRPPSSPLGAVLPDFGGQVVLLAEDNAVNQRVASKMLERLHLRAEVVETGADVLERFDPSRHPLILMDIHMPIMDGLEATKALRRQGFDVPIIALTADVLSEHRQACDAAGMNDYLTKPLQLVELAQRLQMWLEIPASPALDEAPVARLESS